MTIEINDRLVRLKQRQRQAFLLLQKKYFGPKVYSRDEARPLALRRLASALPSCPVSAAKRAKAARSPMPPGDPKRTCSLPKINASDDANHSPKTVF